MSNQEPDYPERDPDDRVDDEGLGPGEPDEVITDPENAAAADAIRESTLETGQLSEDEESP